MKNLFLFLSHCLAGAVCTPLMANRHSSNGWYFVVKADGTARLTYPEYVSWECHAQYNEFRPIHKRLVSSTLSLPETVTEAIYDRGYPRPEVPPVLGATYTVTEIGDEMTVEQRAALTSVSISGTVATIAGGAFENCSLLTGITIPSSVTTIGNEAFSGSGLTSVTVPSTVTSMENFVFRNCTSLQSADIRNSKISQRQFEGCTALTNLTISSNVTTIEVFAFANCTGLEVLTVPTTVTNVDGSAFAGLTGLKTMNYYAKNIPNRAFSGYPIETIDLTGAEIIGSRSFEDCTRLTSAILGNSITSIGGSAFSGCSGLTAITVPCSVTAIGFAAFADCSGLTSVSISEGVTTIGSSAFSGCSGLTSITCKAAVPPVAGFSTFLNVDKNIPVSVPCGSVAAYQAAAHWNEFTNYSECLDGTGINDIAANQLRIYPNPVQNELRITNYQLREGEGDIRIYDIYGRAVETWRAASLQQPDGTATINVSHLPAGIYFVKIGKYTGKFVKE